jgi:hypothetical protein
MSRKNKWRRRGRLEFRRETSRYSDGTPEGGDRLFVRIKGKACVVFGDWDGPRIYGDENTSMYLLTGVYDLGNARKLIPIARDYLNYKSA